MIKIKGIFNNKANQRPFAIQTDAYLPKIDSFLNNRPLRMAKTSNNFHLSRNFSQISQKQNFCLEGISELSSSALSNSKISGSKASCFKKRLRQSSLDPPKIATKQFKFFRFQENILRQAIVKYLHGHPLSKSQNKKIHQIIEICFIIIKNSRNNEVTSKEDNNSEQQIEIDIPQEICLPVQMKTIIDIVKQKYINLMKMSPETKINVNQNNKKIAQIVQTYIKKPTKVQCPDKNDKLNFLNSFLQNYVRSFQMDLSTKKDQSELLLNFYQQIFNKYEQIPFTKDSQYDPIILSNNFKQEKRKKSKRYSRKISVRSKDSNKQQENSKKNIIDDSFIKLRFYNNLRKQVKTLTEDTQKIINDYQNKITQN